MANENEKVANRSKNFGFLLNCRNKSLNYQIKFMDYETFM